MEIEIPVQLYVLLLKEAAETDSAVEDIAESAFRNYMERNDNIVLRLRLMRDFTRRSNSILKVTE